MIFHRLTERVIKALFINLYFMVDKPPNSMIYSVDIQTVGLGKRDNS